MNNFWIPIPEELAFSINQQTLNRVFDINNDQSVWNRALRVLGLEMTRALMVKQESGIVLFNWSECVKVLTSDTLQVKAAESGISYSKVAGLRKLGRVIKKQWILENYLITTLSPQWKKPENIEELRVHSLALGLSILALTMKIQLKPANGRPKNELLSIDFARLLADPSKTPLFNRSTLHRINRIQILRMSMSHAWSEENEIAVESLISNIEDASSPENAAIEVDSNVSLRPKLLMGLPVFPGIVEGNVFVVHDFLGDLVRVQQMTEPPILIFKNARPDSTLYFSYANAVLFANGGVLSHACCVAREQKVPCITALGDSLISIAKTKSKACVNALSGTVEWL